MRRNHVTFFEIDPSVEPIARHFFTFLPRCELNCEVVIGDGRLQLEHMADSVFDLLLLDAFSSDSVPTHLLSREAVRGVSAEAETGWNPDVSRFQSLFECGETGRRVSFRRGSSGLFPALTMQAL